MSCGLTNPTFLLPGLSTQTQKKKGRKNICPSSEMPLLQSRHGIIKVSPLKAMGMGGHGTVPPPPAWETLPDPSPPVLQLELPVLTYDNTWEVEEGGREYKLRFDMPPGITRKDVRVFVEDGRLVVQADKAEKTSDEEEEEEGGEEEEWSVKNHGRGYNRRIKLPVTAEVDNIKAQLKDGLLHVAIPKVPASDKFFLGH